jgi:hypothetical protein
MALILVALDSCGANKVADLPASPTPTASTSPFTGLPDVTATVLDDEDQKFLLQAEEVSPEFTSDDQAALAIGRGVCTRAAAGWNQLQLVTWIRLASSPHTLPTMTDDAGAKLIELAKEDLC